MVKFASTDRRLGLLAELERVRALEWQDLQNLLPSQRCFTVCSTFSKCLHVEVPRIIVLKFAVDDIHKDASICVVVLFHVEPFALTNYVLQSILSAPFSRPCTAVFLFFQVVGF